MTRGKFGELMKDFSLIVIKGENNEETISLINA